MKSKVVLWWLVERKQNVKIDFCHWKYSSKFLLYSMSLNSNPYHRRQKQCQHCMLKPTTIEKISLNETENVTLVSKSITGQISSLFWQKVCILHTFFIDLSLFCNLHLLTYKTYRVSPQAFDQNWRSIFTQIRWLFHFSKPKFMQIFTKILQKMEICPTPCTSLTPTYWSTLYIRFSPLNSS